MKKIITLILCICLVFIFIGLLPVHGEAEIYDNVLRLHVVANSDSEEDQALKLNVRDKIIELSNTLCVDCKSIDDAKKIISQNINSFLLCAEEEVARQGYDYSIEIRLSEENYPTKTYASLCFPSGKYLSLQVLIGEARGQNWWCVLFPPLCIDAATVTNNEDAFISVGLTTEQYKIITESEQTKYQARFKILEVIEKAVK
ncbi:MAG: stage II sporulation protein R [Clostridia bacterium]|nr:stage II sporulation protein R [Clostridia bacterium]